MRIPQNFFGAEGQKLNRCVALRISARDGGTEAPPGPLSVKRVSL